MPEPRSPLDTLHLPESYSESSARDRARRLLDNGSFRELLCPFERIASTWLPRQGIVPQMDDGVIIAQGRLEGADALIIAIEGRFQGGSVGEVSGSKILSALQLTRRDCEKGQPRIPVLLLETGGVRLQEANLGLELISEIHSEIIALRELVPVLCVIAGAVGCFGGMSIAAALCSYILMTPQGRFGLNGPEVIEQEAGFEELDAGDRATVWSLIGGAQRVSTHMADVLLLDDMQSLREQLLACVHKGIPAQYRSRSIAASLAVLQTPEASSVWTGADVVNLLDDEKLRSTTFSQEAVA